VNGDVLKDIMRKFRAVEGGLKDIYSAWSIKCWRS
jgi:hypothetical protein